ncbi:AI-2E family transporter [Pseudonocardia hispaniensis]|uniref:AI-2E family transporter n=1 Tax=Pseudonocardia hispaniensis TaxID=904933 RepID=A0ABW1J416_9PSEU
MVNGRPGGRGSAIGRAVSSTSRWSLRLVLIALGVALLFWLGAQLWVIVLPVLLGLLITTVLWPPVAFLRRHRWPPALAAATVLLGGLIVLGGLITLVTMSIAGSFDEIAAGASIGLERIRQWLVGPPLNLGQSQLDDALSAVTRQLQQSVSSIASGVLTGVGAVTSGVVTGVLALVLAFLFLKDGPRFLPWLDGVVGSTAGSHLSEVSVRIWRTLMGFIHTQAIVALIDAVCIGIGLVIVGVPLALPLAVITFLGGFVPIVGAFVAGALAVLVALVSNGFTTALVVLAIVVAVQQIEGNVLQPILQSRSVQLHAAVVLLAVAAGGTLFGIAGAFLSVPVVAAAAVVLRYLSEQLDGGVGPAEGTLSEPRDGASSPTTGLDAAERPASSRGKGTGADGAAVGV